MLASSQPVPGEPVRTTIDPALQRAAVTALGSLFGGVAVLDTQNGDVLALSGVAYSAPAATRFHFQGDHHDGCARRRHRLARGRIPGRELELGDRS